MTGETYPADQLPADVQTYTSRDGHWACQEWWDPAWHGIARCLKCEQVIDMRLILVSDHVCD